MNTQVEPTCHCGHSRSNHAFRGIAYCMQEDCKCCVFETADQRCNKVADRDGAPYRCRLSHGHEGLCVFWGW